MHSYYWYAVKMCQMTVAKIRLLYNHISTGERDYATSPVLKCYYR